MIWSSTSFIIDQAWSLEPPAFCHPELPYASQHGGEYAVIIVLHTVESKILFTLYQLGQVQASHPDPCQIQKSVNAAQRGSKLPSCSLHVSFQFNCIQGQSNHLRLWLSLPWEVAQMWHFCLHGALVAHHCCHLVLHKLQCWVHLGLCKFLVTLISMHTTTKNQNRGQEDPSLPPQQKLYH